MDSFTAALQEHAEKGFRCTAMTTGGGVYVAWFQKMLEFEISTMSKKGYSQHRWQMLDSYDDMKSHVSSIASRNREVITAMVADPPRYVAWMEPSTDYAAEEPGAYLAAARDVYTFNAFIHGVLRNNKALFPTSYVYGQLEDGSPAMVAILQKDWPHVWNDLEGTSFSNSESTWATRATAAAMSAWIQEKLIGAPICLPSACHTLQLFTCSAACGTAWESRACDGLPSGSCTLAEPTIGNSD